jgi:hypothetical protein
MELLDWITLKRPGDVDSLSGRIEVVHQDGNRSTLWLRTSASIPEPLLSLGDLYEKYDGIDLFSSTFKVASADERQRRGDVDLTFSLKDLRIEFEAYGAGISQDAIPFMIQQGIGIYIIDPSSSEIIEFDTEQGAVSERYGSIFEVLEEWLP